MGVMTHVTRRGACYVWRRRIPKRALQSESDGLSTKINGVIVKVSLETRDLSTACRRAPLARPHTAGDEIVKDALYWVPLIAAYPGLRREEICGLQLEDVVLGCEHPYLDIRQNANRGLKNTQSRRLVPLHQDLIDLGFPDYCTKLRAAGGVDVFPDLKPGTPTNSFGDTLHHRWHELLKRQIGPDTGGKVFHSFRHYVISQLKRSGVGIDIIQDLVGHLHGNVTEDRYSDRTDLALLAEAVNRLSRVL